jgi:hypothetical protein
LKRMEKPYTAANASAPASAGRRIAVGLPSTGTGREIGACPKCRRPIQDTHESAWCTNCGEALPGEITNLLPAVAAIKNASADKLPFSVGAAGITILWLFFHGRPGTAVALIGLNLLLRVLVLLPGLGFLLALIAVVGVIVHFGFEGSKIAMEHKHYKSVEELRSGERGWTIAGAIGLCLCTVFTLVGIAAMLGL